MEYNKLIAEFMGGKYKTVYNGVDNTSCERFYMPDSHITEPIMDFEYLDYHKSWDMLMPVVKKLKEKNTNPNRTIDAKNHGLLNIALMQADIDSIYKQVVTIIKNHNQLNP